MLMKTDLFSSSISSILEEKGNPTTFFQNSHEHYYSKTSYFDFVNSMRSQFICGIVERALYLAEVHHCTTYSEYIRLAISYFGQKILVF